MIAGHHLEGKRSVEMALRDGTLVGHVKIPAKHGRLPVLDRDRIEPRVAAGQSRRVSEADFTLGALSGI
jgi:hypothetical protein